MGKYSLIGVDGNAYAIMGYVRNAMKNERYDKEHIDIYLEEAQSGDYNHLLYVSQKMIDELNEKYL